MRKYFRYWYLFLLGAGLSLLAANLYLRYYAVPQYSISSTLLIKERGNGPDLMSIGTASSNKSGEISNINDEIQVLKSKSLMQRALNELLLYTSYQTAGTIRNEELYGKALQVKIIVTSLDSTIREQLFTLHIKSNSSFELVEPNGQVSSHRFGQTVQKPYGVFTIIATSNSPLSANAHKDLQFKFINTWNLAEYYTRNLSVLPVNKDANVLNLGFLDVIPERGRDVMNKLMEVYNKEALEDKNRVAANTLAFIDSRLKGITSALSGVEKNVEQYKRENEVTDVSTQTSNYLNQASEYNKKLSEWAIQIDILESIEEYLSKTAGQYKMVPSTLGLQDQTLLGLITRFNELQLERERMLRTAQSTNPLVENINEQLSNLRANILENLRNIKSGLVITSRNLKNNSGEFQARIKKAPSIERELLDISRQQATRQTVYLYLLQKREETALALSTTIYKSKVIDPAVPGSSPLSPNPRLMYLMALLFGLGLPFTILYSQGKFNERIQTRSDVEQLTSTPILGELSHNKSGTVVVTKGNFSPLAEMFGLIRAHLATTALEANKVMLVTSSMSGEGKTFFSINLAASLALTGKKVIVLELDFRVPDLLQGIGLSNGVGVTDYLQSDDVSIPDIITPVEKVNNLFVAGSGSIPINPAELMTSPKLAYLINELKVSFDHIVIDTAPVGQVADAFSLSLLANATIYLMRYNLTLKAQVELVDAIYKYNTLPKPMIVLNDARSQNSTMYGYGYGYSQSKKKSGRKLSGVR